MGGMVVTAGALNVEMACALMVQRAQQEGRVPIAWMWGSDVREGFSRWMDAMMSQGHIKADDSYQQPDDGRIAEWCGLPAYPMMADGVALRTVAEQESGFD
jgi:hypothetical protein